MVQHHRRWTASVKVGMKSIQAANSSSSAFASAFFGEVISRSPHPTTTNYTMLGRSSRIAGLPSKSPAPHNVGTRAADRAADELQWVVTADLADDVHRPPQVR